MNGILSISIYAIPGLPKLPQDIAKQVIKNVYGFDHEELIVKTRKREIVLPRQIHITLLMLSGISCSKSAGIFNKDHATAIHSKKTIINLLGTKNKDEYPRIVRAITEFQTYYPSINLSEVPGPWHDNDNQELRS